MAYQFILERVFRDLAAAAARGGVALPRSARIVSNGRNSDEDGRLRLRQTSTTSDIG